MFAEDYIGKRKMFLICLISASFGSLLMFISSSMPIAILDQYFIGFGKFPIINFGIGMISDITKQ